MEVEEATRKIRQLTTTVAAGGIIDERNSNELGAACMLGLDRIRHVPVMHSIRNDVEGGDGEGRSYIAASPRQAHKF